MWAGFPLRREGSSQQLDFHCESRKNSNIGCTKTTSKRQHFVLLNILYHIRATVAWEAGVCPVTGGLPVQIPAPSILAIVFLGNSPCLQLVVRESDSLAQDSCGYNVPHPHQRVNDCITTVFVFNSLKDNCLWTLFFYSILSSSNKI